MLDELAKSAREGIEVPWDELREERVLRRTLAAEPPRVSASSNARLLGWSVGLAVACAAAVAFGFLAGPWGNRAPTTAPAHHDIARNDASNVAPTAATPPDDSRLLLSDGSVVTMSPGAEVAVAVDGAQRVDLRQDRGQADYAILPRPGRSFTLSGGAVVIRTEVAAFSVSVDGHVTTVTVHVGTIELRSGDRELRLVAGERAMLRSSPSETPNKKAAADPDVRPRPQRRDREASTGSKRAPDVESSVGEVDPSAEALMRMADEARRAGQSTQAASALRRLIELYPDDPRVPSAWFTLGRVEDARGRHAAAAEAFEACMRAQARGPLARDAMARAALAWIDAGRRDRSVELAQRYLEQFPGGLHAATMHEIVR